MATKKPEVEAIIVDKNLTAQERARFNRPLSLNELITALKEGSGSSILIAKGANPDDNVVVDYKKRN